MNSLFLADEEILNAGEAERPEQAERADVFGRCLALSVILHVAVVFLFVGAARWEGRWGRPDGLESIYMVSLVAGSAEPGRGVVSDGGAGEAAAAAAADADDGAAEVAEEVLSEEVDAVEESVVAEELIEAEETVVEPPVAEEFVVAEEPLEPTEAVLPPEPVEPEAIPIKEEPVEPKVEVEPAKAPETPKPRARSKPRAAERPKAEAPKTETAKRADQAGGTGSGAGSGQVAAGGSGSSGVGAAGAGAGGENGGAAGYVKGNYEYIKKRIRQKLVYSPQAKRMGIQGTVTVAFVIQNDGRARNVSVAKSSGNDSLDESAVQAVEKASPFPPPPEAARIVVPISFSLK
ncbi:MAG: energy transducer TonB [Deltaproteobacteria bacterium]|jgi:protein TonB|nr:energy transducer TonB [Deltaproteobacteria bacterium]